MNATTMTKREAKNEQNVQAAQQMSASSVAPQDVKQEATPTKLYRVEEIADAAEISLSYVYALIARNKPRVWARDGRSHLYGQDFLDSIKTMQPRRFRRQNVRVISRVAQVIDKRSAMPADVSPQNTLAQEHYTETLLQRIDNLEKKVVQLSSFLGV